MYNSENRKKSKLKILGVIVFSIRLEIIVFFRKIKLISNKKKPVLMYCLLHCS